MSNHEKRTWIYLLRDKATGLYKIGQSIDPVGRLKTLCKQDTLQPTPNDFELIEAWWGYGRDESDLHRLFADQRRRGEWFDFTDAEVEQVGLYFAHSFPFSGRTLPEMVANALSGMWITMMDLKKSILEKDAEIRRGHDSAMRLIDSKQADMKKLEAKYDQLLETLSAYEAERREMLPSHDIRLNTLPRMKK